MEVQHGKSFYSRVIETKRGQAIQKWLEEYFAAGHIEIRTPQQIEKEKYTLFCKWSGSFSRWYLWLPVLITQICIGSLYSWSIFNKSMDQNIWLPRGYSTGANANAFTICVAMFGFGTAVFGPWIEKYGPFWSCLRTLWLTPLGWAFACLGSWLPNLGVLYAGFGICHGLGAAHAYISTCSMIQKWFPEFKGFATGIAVMGFGVGSFIWTSVGKELMDTKGTYKYEAYQVQGIFAAVFFGGLLLSLPFMRLPPPDYAPTLVERLGEEKTCRGAAIRTLAKKSSRVPQVTKSYTLFRAVTQLEFVLLIFMVFGQFITGVVFLSSAADMTQYIFNKDANTGAFITSMLSLCNFTGRFGWGYLSDRIGRKTFYLASTATQAFAVGLMSVWIDRQEYGLWLLSFLLIGSLYGGGFGTLPAFVSDLFGPKISAATHGIMISIWALASIIGIPIFTSYTSKYKHTTIDAAGKSVSAPLPEAYIYNSYWLCAMPAMAFIVLLFLNVQTHDRRLRQKKHDLRVRLCCWVAVCSCRLMGREAQRVEWELDGDEEPAAVQVAVVELPETAKIDAQEEASAKRGSGVGSVQSEGSDPGIGRSESIAASASNADDIRLAVVNPMAVGSAKADVTA